jgi:4-amino-4-deoxy-L-arabinose transferase-like glycosyltransferase
MSHPHVLVRPELLVLLALAAVLNIWSLSTNGFANEYYAAAVRSMSTSWHAFLYGSFDASGLQTVDKPPLALWIQALSVRAFGFSSWSLLLPQAFMGIGSVGLTYDLVRRRFGRAAGFAGGLALALTPITVAISRHNNPDALLVLCCTGALWACIRGLEDGRARWLLLSALLIGLGFETKMAVALMVVPGIAAAWLWVAPRGRKLAIRQLLAGGAVLAVTALAWPMLVWLTPAADRPWVSGTSDNSIWSLILEYNGLGRLLGQKGGGGNSVGGGSSLFGGSTGPLRLLNQSLGGQAGWLLGFALGAGVGLLLLTRLRRTDSRTGWLIVVGGAFLVTAIAFSTAQGIFHPYYVSLLAPFSAALVGAGVGSALRRGHSARLLGAAALAGGVLTEIVVIGASATDLSWLTPAILAGVSIAGAVFLIARNLRIRRVALSAAVAVLLIAPGAWSFETFGHATSDTFPTGGPASTSTIGGGGMGSHGTMGSRTTNGNFPLGGISVKHAHGSSSFTGAGKQSPPAGTNTGSKLSSNSRGAGPGGSAFGGETQGLTAALTYIAAHGGGTLAVSSQSAAAEAILASDANVVGIGGFSGNETQISTAWLAQEVAAGHIRYVLTESASSGLSQGRIGSTEIMALVKKVGTKVSAVSGLYDLQGKAAAIASA